MYKKNDILETLISNYPRLSVCRDEISASFTLLRTCYEQGGKLLVCGNGGSNADASHIVGELMKGFLKKREISVDQKQILLEKGGKRGQFIADRLQKALPAISLGAHQSLLSAVSNDLGADLAYAQQIMGYGRKGDVLLGISTSGNAENVIQAIITAKALGLTTIGLTGAFGGEMTGYCDLAIKVPSDSVPVIQELHLPVYHALCAMLEEYFFD